MPNERSDSRVLRRPARVSHIDSPRLAIGWTGRYSTNRQRATFFVIVTLPSYRPARMASWQNTIESLRVGTRGLGDQFDAATTLTAMSPVQNCREHVSRNYSGSCGRSIGLNIRL